MVNSTFEERERHEMDRYDKVIEFYQSEDNIFLLDSFMSQVRAFFEKNPTLHTMPFPVVHSVKSRLKNEEHLKDKIIRKKAKGTIVTSNNLYNEITDLAGVRVLHLYQEQFEIIHNEILKKIKVLGEWTLIEDPKAYTWDPESKKYYESLGISTEVRETYYTSVHYVVKLNNNNNICCEIQVRTLFEEIWGEIDHALNYPHKTDSVACSEQLRVLSKLVSTGTRLSDSIFRSYKEYQTQK